MRPKSLLPLEMRQKINQANYRQRVREGKERLVEVRLSTSALDHLQSEAELRGKRLRTWFAEWVDAKVREESAGARQ